MKRLLALALAGILGALLLGGCARQHVASPAGAPAGDLGSHPAATVKAAAPGTSAASSPSSSAASSSADVASLFSDVDKQLHNDDQPSQDQD